MYIYIYIYIYVGGISCPHSLPLLVYLQNYHSYVGQSSGEMESTGEVLSVYVIGGDVVFIVEVDLISRSAPLMDMNIPDCYIYIFIYPPGGTFCPPVYVIF